MKREVISKFLSDPFFATKVNIESLGNITCIIQPASNDDLQILPEGDRYNPTVRLFSRIKLTNGMLFHHHDMRFKVTSESIWRDYGYYDCLATRYDGSQAHDSGGFDIT